MRRYRIENPPGKRVFVEWKPGMTRHDTALGARDGAKLGVGDGDVLGGADGASVGSLDGKSEGNSVGVNVVEASDVGASVGAA